MIGVVALVVVALIVGVVTLGSSVLGDDEPSFDELADESRSEDDGAARDDRSADDDRDEAADDEDPGGAGLTASELLSDAVATELTAGRWALTDAHPTSMTGGVSACVPDGWLSDAKDRFTTAYTLRDGEVGTVTVTLTAYTDDEAAAADLRRARTDQYLACQEQQEFAREGRPVDIVALPDDPLAPGVGFEHDGGESYAFTVVVGRARANVQFCGCTHFDTEGFREVARQVATAMADAQNIHLG